MVNLFLVSGEIRKCHYKGEQNARVEGKGVRTEEEDKERRGSGEEAEEDKRANTSTKLETNPVRMQLTFQCPK